MFPLVNLTLDDFIIASGISHMPQMVGLALGCTPAELGLNHHVTKVDFV
ncbi:MAG: hypothetical protein Q8N01_06640 [Sulfuricurvum sp.]|nr:hypothetical protein [Sulfuricurvum sp.]